MKKLIALLMIFGMILSLTACKDASESNSEKQQSSTTKDEQINEDETSAPTREAEITVMMSFPQYMEQWEK